MRRLLISCSAIAAVCLLLCQPVAAQDKEKDKEKDKNKVSENDEIIIKRKGDKDTRVIIEIKDDEITINGKPLIEFNDDNIVINRRKSLYSPPHSPFRGQGGTLSFSEKESSDVAYLGVITEDDDKGARIEDVTDNSAAEKAGLKEGDIISKIDDVKIERPDDLTKVVRKHKPEDKITITYYRDGKSNKTEATLGKRKERVLKIESPHFEAEKFNFDWKDSDFGPRLHYSYGSRPKLGIKAQDTEDGKGVKVLDIDNESAAEKAGIQKNDVITGFDGKKISTTDQLVEAARESREKTSVKVTFSRDGKEQTVELKTPRKLKTANL